MSTLSGKLAIVTGGSRGIGAETARQLAAEGATTSQPEYKLMINDVTGRVLHLERVFGNGRHAIAPLDRSRALYFYQVRDIRAGQRHAGRIVLAH